MTNPLLTIICITYNQDQFIAQAIEGFLMQKTSFPIEIIIHDDCSTDGTRNIINEYIEKYPELIKPIFQKENQYSLGKRIIPFVLPHCKGKYIAICEGDDYWTDPNKLQKQVDFLESNPDYVICFHPVNRLVNGELITDTQNQDQAETTTILELCRNNYIHTASCVFRNNLFEKLPDTFNKSPAGDYFLHLLNAQYGKIKFLDERMSVYRVHENSLWSSMTYLEQLEASCKVFEVLIDYFDGEIKSALLSSYIELSQAILSKNNTDNHILAYYKSGINNPYFIMEQYDLKVIAKGFILKCLKHIGSLINTIN